MKNRKAFYTYFTQNLLKGFVYLIVLIGLVMLFKNYFSVQFDAIEHAISDSYPKMFLIFLISELFVGLIPPELFMVWTLDDPLHYYILSILVMTVVSIFAGWLNYRFGRFIANREFFLNLLNRRLRLKKYQKRFEQYGSGIIIVSAVTPLPFALISLLTGTLSFPQKKYLFLSSFRVLRFIAYGIAIYEVGGLL